jgi:hypothetical protein
VQCEQDVQYQVKEETRLFGEKSIQGQFVQPDPNQVVMLPEYADKSNEQSGRQSKKELASDTYP